MATSEDFNSPFEMPKLPSGHVKAFIPYLAKHPNTPIAELLEPYKAFESELRKVYAQDPTHEAVRDGSVNLVPIFDGHESELKIRARNLDTETEEGASKYIMTLKDDDRRKDGSSAIVSSFKDFQQNFNLFSESSLADLNWDNVVAAGSAVTTALLPVPEKWSGSKRSLREYYHEHLAPASDVDLFIYGLNEEQALEKIKQIERNVKDSILHETTTIRTKNAITIASQYPTRHVQIVLRLYDSISQIITGFDVDCACAAYDGSQVHAAPRAIAAFITQCNTIDLTRRSPSYENRLSKYSHRGFEVHWPLLDRTRIDPTIFERSFGRTQGLARLLVLEKLPKSADRDSYMDQRRAERGRPALHRGYRRGYKMADNIKDQEEDDIAEWVDQEEVASYHTMTVPYGPRYMAGKINRLLYAKDLLLNAEWNQPDDREVYLHRHPCFFGTAEEVLQDCCGYCPIPKTDEEIEIAEEEKKTNVSGALQFLKDDPGRQEIGSFNPITDDEWTTMAYVGDTARLCQAIVDGDLEHVQDWCSQEGVDVNRRDYTGRTPLHLAVMASTPEIVKCLIDHGARMVARLVDGRTALHIAAARGNTEMVKALMDKSLANEEDEEEKKDARRAARKAKGSVGEKPNAEDSDEDSETASIDLGSEDTDESDDMTMGSFVKVDKEKEKTDDGVPEDSLDDPDVYDINVIAWDYGLSPLHLAILNGHLDTIELLVSEYGADVLLPVKLVHPGTSNARGAIMTLILAMALPIEKSKEIIKLLLKLGATSAQADMNHFTAFHQVVNENNDDILDVLLDHDRPAAMSILNNIGYSDRWGNETDSPLTTAVKKGYHDMTMKLLELGAKPEITFDDWIKAYLAKNAYAKNSTPEQNLKQYHNSVNQPIIVAAVKDMDKTVEALVAHGASPNTLEKNSWAVVESNNRWQAAESLLDIIQAKLKTLRKYKVESEYTPPVKPFTLHGESWYTSGLKEGTYEFFNASRNYQKTRRNNKKQWEAYEKRIKDHKEDGYKEKKEAINKLTRELERLENSLIAAGAKTFKQLHPDFSQQQENRQHNNQYEKPKPTPYTTELNFQVPDLNPIKKIGYTRLFEAAWNNNLETLKSLTLAPWENEVGKPLVMPLKIAVKDGNGFTPFSIAVLRGHYDLARKIIGIATAQLGEGDDSKPRQRWTLNAGESDDEGYSDGGDDDSAILPIYHELVSDKYTIDNLGQISDVVKSDVAPLTMMEWPCYTHWFSGLEKENDNYYTILGHAVVMNDMGLFKFIVQIGAEQQALLAEEDDDQKSYTIPRDIFQKAIKLGRTDLLAEMIRLTGVGIPLNELVKTSGVELKTKPRYYQGLTVGGRKRADWAQAPGGTVHVIEERIPPLLQAAHVGSIESVEWFMSDAPMRRYKEFAEENKHDKRIKTLHDTGKGFDKTISAWLDAKSELTLHCAILYNPYKKSESPQYLALIKHLVSVLPDSIEQKSSEGWTPLQVALFAQRQDAVEYLISIGANQRHRDKIGRNMMHTMVATRYQSANTDAKSFKELVSLFDTDSVKNMLVERCAHTPGALTPLALWLSRNGRQYKKTDFLKILCAYSTGEDLEMINGEGDLPLHVAIKNDLTSITSYLLSFNPALLHRENATGRTPFEMSRDIYLSSLVSDPPNMESSFYYYPNNVDWHFITHQQAANFAPPKPKDEEIEEEIGEQNKKRTYDVCVQVDEELMQTEKEGEQKRKRRLVSLFEANEVAKRLAGTKRGYRGGRHGVFNGYLVEDVKTDVVSEWMGSL